MLPNVHAAPKLRFQTDVKGDIVLIGNTLWPECRAVDSLACRFLPVVGTVETAATPSPLMTARWTLLWRADDPTAKVDGQTMIGDARSTSMLATAGLAGAVRTPVLERKPRRRHRAHEQHGQL